MATRPWFPLYPADYLADTQHLDTHAHGAYLLLLLHHWKHMQIPEDAEQLQAITRVHPDKWRRTWAVLSDFFQSTGDGYLVNKRMLKELKKTENFAEISEKRRAAAQQMHSKRAANTNANAHAKRQQKHPTTTTTTTTTVGAKAPTGERARDPPDDDWPGDYKQQFWEAYPHKIGMASALTELTDVRGKRKTTWMVLINATHAYADKTDDRKWANPKTWLEQERWNDRPATARHQNGGQRPRSGDTAARLARQAEERERSASAAQREDVRIGGTELGGDDAVDVSRS